MPVLLIEQQPGTVSFQEARAMLLERCCDQTVIIGHALNNDLVRSDAVYFIFLELNGMHHESRFGRTEYATVAMGREGPCDMPRKFDLPLS